MDNTMRAHLAATQKVNVQRKRSLPLHTDVLDTELPEVNAEKGTLPLSLSCSAGAVLFPSEGFEEDILLEAHPALKQPEIAPESAMMLVMQHSCGRLRRGGSFLAFCGRQWRQRHIQLCSGLFGIEEHGGAETVLPLLRHENVVVYAAAAAFPEFLVGGELRIGHGFITQIGVDFHHRQARGQAKYLGMRVFLAR